MHMHRNIQMDTKADGLAEEPGWCLLWMPNRWTLLMHTDTVDWMMYQYGCSTDRLVHTDTVVIHYGCSAGGHADAQ